MTDLNKLVDEQFDLLITELKKIISFNTEKAPAKENAPFGTEIRNCLDYVLNLAKNFGFETYDCDGYAGHVDFVGTGKEVLGILGHLDVVPAKAEEWNYPPFDGVVANGKLFGRGTMDDKGPMIACLFAIKALKDAGFVPSKTIRLIFGCDEESGMECVEHYFSKMPFPNISFSPDGDFPVINREKGIYQFDIVCGKLPSGVTISAGDRANVVPSLCKAYLPHNVSIEANNNISISKDESNTIITSVGKAAHGSTPDEGINATHPILKLLSNLYSQNETLSFLANKVCDTSGKSWNINLTDEPSGKLTCNLGVLRTTAEGNLVATVDIRFPVSYNCKQMYDILRKNTPSAFEIVPKHTSEPLFVPSDSYLVTTLMDIYNKKLNVNAEPLAIGGGTYSRCLPNCVAFGPMFPGEESTIHMPNECIIIENYRLMTKLYIEAIYRLSK